MDREQKLAYMRGYNTGSRGRWPEHIPPQPPNKLVADLMKACRTLRNGVDNELAMLEEGDEWNQRLGPLIDAVDEQFTRIGKWIKEGSNDPAAVEIIQAARAKK